MSPLDITLAIVAAVFGGLFCWSQWAASRERRDVYDRLQAGTLAALDAHKHRQSVFAEAKREREDREREEKAEREKALAFAAEQAKRDEELSGRIGDAMAVTERFGH